MTIAMCFDLSSTCIGVTFAQFHKKDLFYAKTLAVIPEKPSGKALGFTTNSPKTLYSNGKELKTFIYPGETSISSVEEAKKRVTNFKNYRHRYLLNNIGKQLGYYIDKVKPDVVAIERNETFNGILTSKLLAEIAGGIYFFSGARGIPMYDYPAPTIRAKIRKDITDFNRYKAGTDEMALDTKWEIFCRLRSYFEKNHPNMQIDFENITMDESDSLAVFYHLFTTEDL